MLRRLTSPQQLAAVGRRPREPHPIEELRSSGMTARDVFVEAALAACG
jgi:hypothetical protein